ncbi:MAG: peptidylprolyl isomerase [candidate division Zixibacteria bacterium]|nr:peptidylprolyl isomerase [candidate division Zixibacteria bacterium]
MKLANVTLLSGILLVFALLTVGCGSSDSKVVAKVGGYEITEQELNDVFQGIRYPYTNAEEEYQKKQEILDTIIVNRLLIQAAYKKNIDQLEELNRVVVANKDKFLLDVLYLRKVVDKSDVTDAEVRDHWEKIAEKVRASHILVDNLDTANVLLERIKSGENFDKLAFEYSIDPSAKRNKGDLGYFLYGSMVKEFQDAAFAMQPGEISPPVKTNFGYHIIKLVDKATNEKRTDFESMKNELEQQIINKKRLDLMNAYYEEIESKYPITVDTTTCNYIIKKREYLYPPELLKTLPRNDFDIEQLDRNEKELVLATWDGGQMTIQEYLEMAKQIPAKMKPNFDNFDSLKTVIFQLKRLDLLSYESIREGLDKDKEYLRKVRLFKELSMADIMRNDSIPKPLPPDDSMIRQYYDENSEKFTDPAKVHVYEILLSDELKAKKLAKETHSLDKFKSKAMDLTERPGKRAVQGNLDYIERKWFPAIFDLARKTKIGKIGGPVVSHGKYSIFYVVDKLDEQIKDFLTVKNEIKGIIARQQIGEAFVSWVKERKENTDIEIYDDVLYGTVDQEKYKPDTLSAN